MARTKKADIAVVIASFLVAMVLAVIPMPQSLPAEFGYLRPDWVALVLIYWVIALPYQISVFAAWLAGIIMDLILGDLLGQHALCFVFILYVATYLHQRLRMLYIWQQGLIVFLTLALSQLVYGWVESLAGTGQIRLWDLLPAVSGALLWPLMLLVLRGSGRWRDVS